MTGGRRSILQNFLVSQNALSCNFWVETTCEYEYPTLPADFLSTISDFSSFFGQSKSFWTLVSGRRPAGRPTKKFDRSYYTTFKHFSIMLRWSDDIKESPPKKFTSPLQNWPHMGEGKHVVSDFFRCINFTMF